MGCWRLVVPIDKFTHGRFKALLTLLHEWPEKIDERTLSSLFFLFFTTAIMMKNSVGAVGVLEGSNRSANGTNIAECGWLLLLIGCYWLFCVIFDGKTAYGVKRSTVKIMARRSMA